MCLDCNGCELSLRVPAGVLHGQSTMITDPVSGMILINHNLLFLYNLFYQIDLFYPGSYD